VDWGAVHCGGLQTARTHADKDLGMNRKHKQTVKNFGPNDGHCNPNRAFGIPSVRSDIDKRGMKSVADPLN